MESLFPPGARRENNKTFYMLENTGRRSSRLEKNEITQKANKSLDKVIGEKERHEST